MRRTRRTRPRSCARRASITRSAPNAPSITAGSVPAPVEDGVIYVWDFKNRAPLGAGVPTTAGDLVFTGTAEDFIEAFDAKIGEEVRTLQVRMGVGSSPITWERDGERWIGFALGCGGDLVAPERRGRQDHRRHQTGRKLPGVRAAEDRRRALKRSIPARAPASAVARAPVNLETSCRLRRWWSAEAARSRFGPLPKHRRRWLRGCGRRSAAFRAARAPGLFTIGAAWYPAATSEPGIADVHASERSLRSRPRCARHSACDGGKT